MRIPPAVRLALLCAVVCPASLAINYRVTPIPLVPGSTGASIAGITDSGLAAGSFRGPSGEPLANFLYTPGAGITNLQRTGPPSLANFEGSAVTAINGSGQILLASGLLYAPNRAVQDLAPAVRAAYPAEPIITFVSLNDSGMVSGTSTNGGSPGAFSQHIFRYAPAASSGVVTVAFTNNNRTFPRGPFVMDDAANVIYSEGFPPAGATVFTAAGATRRTFCGHGNGWATAVNNSGQTGGGWGRMTAFPEICTLDPNTSAGVTTALVDESDLSNAGFVSGLNNKGDGVGWRGGLSFGIPTLFTNGQVIDVNTLFPTGSGWKALTADRINDTGEIAGSGTLNGTPTAFILTPAPATTWSPQSLCFGCDGILLSNSGFTVTRAGSSPLRFHITSPRGTDVTLVGAATLQQINDAGAVVGADVSGRPFVANPPYSQFYNLDTVFGWNRGVATGINDGNDVIGLGSFGSLGPPFENLRIVNLFAINNAGQITGSYLDSQFRTQYFLYTPGAGIENLANRPIALSNTGHLLVSLVTGDYALIKSDSVIPLPSGFIWRALNDRDELVGDCNAPAPADCAAWYSLERGLIRLTVLGFNLHAALAINNAGQILANASTNAPAALQTLLLTPGVEILRLSRVQVRAENRPGIQVRVPQVAEQRPELFLRSVNGRAR